MSSSLIIFSKICPPKLNSRKNGFKDFWFLAAIHGKCILKMPLGKFLKTSAVLKIKGLR